MNLSKYSQLKFRLVLGTGALIASVLCIQCVRTYWYTESVLVPQQAEREAERQAGALSTAARSAGVSDSRALAPVMEHVLESAANRVLWMRVLDSEGNVVAQGGKPQGTATVPARWWEHVEKHENLGAIVDTPAGKSWVGMLPFRLPRPPRLNQPGGSRTDPQGPPPSGPHAGAYVIEVAIPLEAVAGSFEGLRQNLVVGVIASIALLLSLAVIALRTQQYLRGKYLESELQLARRVQSDLQPKPQSVLPSVQFGASSVAADHVGGDFHDIFETESGKVGIVLGDVSGKGISAALLVSVLQGAIRSSTASQHEHACERINHMLCERTACERFATLFWGVFDPATNTLRYVNAGHAAPMLVQKEQGGSEDGPERKGETKTRIVRLGEGGPVRGMLPKAEYAAGLVEIGPSDTLLLYSDGINEAANQDDEEFGERRILQTVIGTQDAAPLELCESIMRQVTTFANGGAAPDDRTIMAVRFAGMAAGAEQRGSEEMSLQAVA